MKSSRFLALALALMMALSLTAFAEGDGLIIKDMTGKEVTITKEIKRIVILQPADCEILYAIGAGDLLVGRGEYCNYPEEVLQVPSVQSGFETNFEQIIALNPDLVILTKMGQTEDDSKKLEEAGIIAITSDAQSISDVYTAIDMIGKITGKTDEADQLIASMKQSFEDITKKAEGKEGSSVYFEVSPLEYGLWAAGTGTFMDEIAAMLGLKNAFEDLTGWQSVSEEQVLARDPDYIVTTAIYFGDGQTPVEEVMGRPNWSDIKAVKNNQVFNADSDAITRPGPRLVDAAEAFYTFVYESQQEADKAA